MSRQLIVLRHAKSAWDTDAKSDHERPLNKRGRRDAPRIAAEIMRLGWRPERVISSDALRTKQTWKRMRKVFDVGGDHTLTSDGVPRGRLPREAVTYTRAFYGAGLKAVAAALADVGTPKIVMVIGHNPGWEEAVSKLTGEVVSMTTCNAALLRSAGNTWVDIRSQRWTLEAMLRPKEL